MNKNKIFGYAVSVISSLSLLSTTCIEEHEILKIVNDTDGPIVAVLTRDNPTPYWTDYYDIVMNGVINSQQSIDEISESSQKEYFARVSVVQILVYDASGEDFNIGELFEKASKTRCELVRYVYSPKDLAKMGWTVTVTTDDILEYQSLYFTANDNSLN